MGMKIFLRVRYQRKEIVECVAGKGEGAGDVTGSTTAVFFARRKTGKSTNQLVWNVKYISRNGGDTEGRSYLLLRST